MLPDGRIGLPREDRVQRFDVPGFAEAAALDYPGGHAGPWNAFRDYGDGRLLAVKRQLAVRWRDESERGAGDAQAMAVNAALVRPDMSAS